jgi:Zn-dependent metalloprotease
VKTSKSEGRYGTTKHFKVCSVLPPFMLESIAFNSSGTAAAAARSTLLSTARLSGQRDRAPMRTAMASPGPKQRVVYDARNAERLPGVLMLHEGSLPSSDVAIAEAYNGAGLTYDMLLESFGRNSLDGQGLRLDSTVKYGRSYLNAFWNGNQMVYGDGDGKLFNRFTICPDICGHELWHGHTQYCSNLQYQDQSGALNESLSDCFGTMVKQRLLGQTADKADWAIGVELLTDRVQGHGIRNLLNPGTAYDDPILGKDPQPASMDDYLGGDEDSGQVHGNSGIPNRAFAVAAVSAGGFTIEKIGKVWYTAATRYLTYSSDFSDMAAGTIAISGQLFGVGGDVEHAVRAGWDKVKVKTSVLRVG